MLDRIYCLLLVASLLIKGHHAFSISKKSIPEYTTIQDDDDDTNLLTDLSFPTTSDPSSSSGDHRSNENSPLRKQLIAVTTGTVLKINVGDVSSAHKAWKKRRRTNSPLLVPCSILNVSRPHAVISNIVFLVKKFGAGHVEQKLTVSELLENSRKHLMWSLPKQAELLGYDSVMDLLQDVFGNNTSPHPSGIQFDVDSETLTAPWSRLRAHATLGQYGVLQFQDADAAQQLAHTGRVRTRTTNNSSNTPYILQDLSAALRLSCNETNIPAQGDNCYAVVYGFDESGDAGAPLLTVSLNPKQPFSILNKKLTYSGRDIKNVRNQIQAFDHEIRDLKIGDALQGTVIALHRGYALVDCKVGNNAHRVLGKLRFSDTVVKSNNKQSSVVSRREKDKNDPELNSTNLLTPEFEDENVFEEDITHLFTQNDDGSLEFKDPETGKTHILFHADNRATESASSSAFIPHKQKLLKIGDTFKVFVKSISTQSNMFTLTLDDSIVGKSARTVKRETHVDKKLSRLLKQVGGRKTLKKIRGLECDGFVQATSNTGDWVYIQPMQDGDENLPIGVASTKLNLQKGDSVRIRLSGVDEDRGQLAIEVLEKI